MSVILTMALVVVKRNFKAIGFKPAYTVLLSTFVVRGEIHKIMTH